VAELVKFELDFGFDLRRRFHQLSPPPLVAEARRGEERKAVHQRAHPRSIGTGAGRGCRWLLLLEAAQAGESPEFLVCVHGDLVGLSY
jgi:hypothetical protein